MKREIFIHFSFWFAFFVLISIFKNYLSLVYWPFWIGGIVGTLLPDIDHLVYVFYMNPQDLTSQRVNFLIKKKEIARVITLLYETRSERKNLIFHTFIFQAIFFILTFFIMSSSSSILVRGIVLSFMLHLFIDQLADIFEMKNLSNWGQFFSSDREHQKSTFYIFIIFLLVCMMGFLM